MIGWRYVGDWSALADQFALNPAVGESRRMLHIIRRDAYTCRLCGFKSRSSKQVPHGYMMAAPPDMDYREKVSDRWRTFCPFCFAGMHLKEALQSGYFTLIAASWMSQALLNNTVRPILCITNQPDHMSFSEANQLHKRLISGEAAVGSLIPHIPATEQTPAENIHRYIELLDSTMSDDQYDRREYFTSGLRLLPTKKYPADHLGYWYAGIYKNYPLRKWERLPQWIEQSKSSG